MLSRTARQSVRAAGTRGFFGNATDSKSAVDYFNSQGAEVINLKFTDILGTLQHITLGKAEVGEGIFKNGIGFDGSSIRMWQQIHNSDMLLMPDPRTAHIDPFSKAKTASVYCDIKDPCNNNAPYDKDPRYVLQKANKLLTDSGIADHARVGPEAEFFLFDDVRYTAGNTNHASYFLDSAEGHWNTNRVEEGGNLAYKCAPKAGYFPAAPFDTHEDIRVEMMQIMERNGMVVEAGHHEVASGGQCEIDFQFGETIDTADRVVFYKYVVRNVARRHGKVATFMAKPLYGDNGSGMHQHYSLHAPDGTNLFTGDSHAGLSEMGIHFIGGIMEHADSILAITNPGTNSYRRLVPGYEAPIYAAYSARNRSAFIRIPISHPKGRRAEFRTPDPTCNPYLSFSAIMCAGIDGIKRKIDPGLPVDYDLYEASPEQLARDNIKSVPSTLKEAIEALKRDNDYLKAGGVFTDDLLEAYIGQKEQEWTDLLLQPTPDEFVKYLDC